MELDQKIFAWAWRRGRRLFGAEAEAADIGGGPRTLELFAALIFGRSMEIVPVAQVGGLRGARLELPLGCPLLGEVAPNLEFLRLRIMLLATGEACASFRGRLRLVCAEYPHGRALFRRVRAGILHQEASETPRHRTRRQTPGPRLLLTTFPERSLQNEAGLQAPTGPSTGKDARKDAELEELQVQKFDESELLTANEKEITDYTLGHNFEKIETLDDFSGSWRDIDEEQDLQEAAEALRELRFSHRIRTAETPQSMVAADLPPGTIAESTDTSDREQGYIPYDEWDASARKYRKNFCRVFESSFHRSQPGFAQAVLARQRRLVDGADARLRRALLELHNVRRERAGESPDLDAVVNARGDMAAGHSPDDRLYQTKRRRQRDLALFFLIDLSLSTDAWVRGHRVLDTEREAVLICGEILERYGTSFAIGGFFSHTRNDCRMQLVKNFAQPWHGARDKLGALMPTGYTRIGPAVRRATDLLLRQKAGKRWLLLFSDARPSDYDRYEGRYGLADVRQAVREADQVGVACHGFGVHSGGRGSLEQMLGGGRGEMLANPAQLPLALIRFTERLLDQA
jgi:nitric oxide reductase NorD protein